MSSTDDQTEDDQNQHRTREDPVTQTRSDATSPSSHAASNRRGSPPARLARFFREVVAELTKVIWPSRSDLITYTIVVIVFVAIMIAIVAGLDVGFAKAVVSVFG